MDEHVPDNDWISRRWQGEGQVVRKDPVRAGEAPVKAQRPTQRSGGGAGAGPGAEAEARAGAAEVEMAPSRSQRAGQRAAEIELDVHEMDMHDMHEDEEAAAGVEVRGSNINFNM